MIFTHVIMSWYFLSFIWLKLNSSYNLQVLSIARNNISVISSSAFVSQNGWQFLYLGNNSISILPFLNSSRYTIREFDMSNNSIFAIDDDYFANFMRLKTLILSNNKISEISRANLRGLSALTRFELSGNHIAEVTCDVQYIPRNMHTVFVLLCFVVVIHWLIYPYPSGLLHWHCGYLTIAPVPAMQPWWIWINTWCEFIMNDCITTTKPSTTKPCAYFLGYTVFYDCVNLETLSIGGDLTSLPCVNISNTSHALKVLDLKFNRIQKVLDTSRDQLLSQLTKLDMTRNGLLSLKNIITEMPSLETLNVAGNPNLNSAVMIFSLIRQSWPRHRLPEHMVHTTMPLRMCPNLALWIPYLRNLIFHTTHRNVLISITSATWHAWPILHWLPTGSHAFQI